MRMKLKADRTPTASIEALIISTFAVVDMPRVIVSSYKFKISLVSTLMP
jgi:hypothetical protein